MKSNVIELTGDKSQFSAVLNEVEKVADYNGLVSHSKRQLRLLTEELLGMLPEILDYCDGVLWIENDKNRYSICTSLVVVDRDLEFRERVLSISKSGKNVAAKGIMGKIRAAAEMMIEFYSNPDVQKSLPYFEMGTTPSSYYSNAWSLSSYKNSAEEAYRMEGEEDDWDELEKSIVANLADDVIVGIKGSKVDIVIKKKF